MKDSRISIYRRALSDIVQGTYPRSLPVSDNDDVGRLGAAILGLSRTLENRFDEHRKLIQVTVQANAGLLVDEILDEFYASFRGLIPYDRIGLALLENQGRVLRARWARSDAETVHLKRGYAASMDRSSLQFILETGRPRILNDLEAYLEDHPKSESTSLMVQEGVRSSLTCPLIAVGKSVGFLFFSSFQKNTYRDAHIDLFMQIASQLSTIVEKGRLYEELKRVNSELHQTQERLQFLVSHDALTGLRNRHTLADNLQREWDRASRYRQPLSALMIDIDFFKQFNDLHGHLEGDGCIQSVARVVQEHAARSADLAVRYGGEEFLAILPDTDSEGAYQCAERMRACVEALQIRRGRAADSPVVTISVGVATAAPDGSHPPSTLIAAADDALYAAKQSGRNRVSVGNSWLWTTPAADQAEYVGVAT